MGCACTPVGGVGAAARKPARRWFGAGGCVGPGVLLILLPKCPACIAAYCAVWAGLGIAAPVAEYLRPVLAVILGVSVVYLVIDRLRMQRRAAN
jgi:hypothetical protein